MTRTTGQYSVKDDVKGCIHWLVGAIAPIVILTPITIFSQWMDENQPPSYGSGYSDDDVGSGFAEGDFDCGFPC